MKKFFYDLSPHWLRKLIWGIDDRRVLLRDNDRFRHYLDSAD